MRVFVRPKCVCGCVKEGCVRVLVRGAKVKASKKAWIVKEFRHGREQLLQSFSLSVKSDKYHYITAELYKEMTATLK